MCHNFAGSGGALTHGKFAASLKGVTAKHMYEAMLTGPQSMPVFGDGTMTPQDKKEIIAYLKTIDAQSNPGGAALGKVGPVTEGGVGWIVGIGGLIGAAVWLGAKAR
jgi:ubiquinol-cytochrome c reductase cytochrome c subunit